ncbi:hypothetical protein Dimus_016419 [Dionaea muscipula]
MLDHGLNNVMELIKRQKWENLFKRREFVHVDAVKEFYAKLTMSHNRKKDVAKSKVRGVKIEFDHVMLASILGIPGNNGISKEPGSSGVDPSGPSGNLPEAMMNKLQAEFERARANRFQADLEKARVKMHDC